MKDQFSSNYDDPIIANQRFKNKLDFLQRQSIKRQNYLKDLQRNFKLSKQTIKSLTQKNPSQSQVIKLLHQQNSNLVQKLKQQFNSICKLNALYLMQCQLRIQQSKSFNERIRQFQQNIAQLRRYLHDKQQSFSFVAQKLKKYQQLLPNQQLTMYQKLINYSGIVKQQVKWKHIFNQIIQDRDLYKRLSQQYKDKYQKSQILVQSIKNTPQFSLFQKFVNNLNSQTTNKTYAAVMLNNKQSHIQNETKNQVNLSNNELKNQANQSTNLTYSQPRKLSIQPNIQLIRLMKKQKLNNKILQAALNEAIDKNLQLIQYNQRLIQNNQNLRSQTDYIIADMVVLCDTLTKYDQNYRTKLRILKHKSKCDIDTPSYKQIIQKYKRNDINQAKYILFTKMRNDVNQLTEFIALCPLAKTNNIPSYQSPRKNFYHQQGNLQISLNQKQFDVSQI